MPTVAAFKGVKIEMYGDEHPPPHFHARYAEFVTMVAIGDLEVLEGSLPLPQLRLVRQWASMRTNLLLAAWAALETDHHPGKIR